MTVTYHHNTAKANPAHWNGIFEKDFAPFNVWKNPVNQSFRNNPRKSIPQGFIHIKSKYYWYCMNHIMKKTLYCYYNKYSYAASFICFSQQATFKKLYQASDTNHMPMLLPTFYNIKKEFQKNYLKLKIKTQLHKSLYHFFFTTATRMFPCS